MIQLINGDCLEEMKKIPENSVDAIVTDPPYGLEFMGKDWDKGVPDVKFWVEMMRVLKPGGYVLSFSGTRTYHRMATAIEDAGFEVRDMIEWVYGSGFPKSLNIGKAVDKLQGNEREVLKESTPPPENFKKGTFDNRGPNSFGNGEVTKGTSEWEGWGTALKPAHEPVCMARKPLAEKTVAENCLRWKTGGINIDESRVGTDEQLGREQKAGPCNPEYGFNSNSMGNRYIAGNPNGRFPANLIHDNSEEVRGCFPETGVSKGGQSGVKKSGLTYSSKWDEKENSKGCGFGDSGNASRFFKSIIYQAKASKSERNKGCEGLEEKYAPKGNNEGRDMSNPKNHLGGMQSSKMQNNHPTVKPIALMEYLINMVTPKGGTVLDPFMGSGTTGIAAKNLDRNFIGIELDVDYFNIAKTRIGV